MRATGLLAVLLAAGLLALTGCAGTDSPVHGSSPSGRATRTTVAAPSFPPKDYTGKGDDVVTIQKPAGPAIVAFSCSKCSNNTSVKTDGADRLLVNEIGSYAGRHLIDTRAGTTIRRLTIKATGSWKITLSGVDTAMQANGPVSGKGDDVVSLAGSTTTAAVTNRGESNFAVKVYPTDGSSRPDLAVNEIGSYTGTVPLTAPALIAVTSSGTWKLTPAP